MFRPPDKTPEIVRFVNDDIRQYSNEVTIDRSLTEVCILTLLNRNFQMQLARKFKPNRLRTENGAKRVLGVSKSRCALVPPAMCSGGSACVPFADFFQLFFTGALRSGGKFVAHSKSTVGIHHKVVVLLMHSAMSSEDGVTGRLARVRAH